MRIDPIRCTGRGLCAEILPELIQLDDWGFPVISGILYEAPWPGRPGGRWRPVPSWRSSSSPSPRRSSPSRRHGTLLARSSPVPRPPRWWHPAHCHHPTARWAPRARSYPQRTTRRTASRTRTFAVSGGERMAYLTDETTAPTPARASGQSDLPFVALESLRAEPSPDRGEWVPPTPPGALSTPPAPGLAETIRRWGWGPIRARRSTPRGRRAHDRTRPRHGGTVAPVSIWDGPTFADLTDPSGASASRRPA